MNKHAEQLERTTCISWSMENGAMGQGRRGERQDEAEATATHRREVINKWPWVGKKFPTPDLEHGRSNEHGQDSECLFQLPPPKAVTGLPAHGDPVF